jgi:uncharacterized SAM-binding protein YcdF (DUF218 family)
MFALKKILGHLLMPLPLGLGLLTLGLLLLLLRRRVRGWFLLVLGWLVLAIAANRAVSLALTASLEKTYPPIPALVLRAPANDGPELAPTPPGPLADITFIAVLGAGNGDASALPAGQRLSASARARLVEGLRLGLALPEAWLVVSGPRDATPGADPAEPTHARVLADAAVELGFPRDRIVEVDTARDTAEEIDALRLLVGDEPVALVTSAWHLPRAMTLATAAKLSAVPCPADYLGGRDASVPRLAYVTWDAESLVNTTRAWREYLGRLWTGLRSRRTASPPASAPDPEQTDTQM